MIFWARKKTHVYHVAYFWTQKSIQGNGSITIYLDGPMDQKRLSNTKEYIEGTFEVDTSVVITFFGYLETISEQPRLEGQK